MNIMKSLLQCLIILTCGFASADNLLVKNPGFEQSTHIADKPDYWTTRFDKYHYIEKDLENVYEGKQCALFNNNSTTPVECYFYGPASVSSDRMQYIDVNTGDAYSLSCWAKLSSNFTGGGIKISLMFLKDNKYISRVDSVTQVGTKWTKMTVQATVPDNAEQMAYSIEYSGVGKAWFDKVKLSKNKVSEMSSLSNVDMALYQERDVLIGYPTLISKTDINKLMKNKTTFNDLKNNMRMISWTFGKLTPEAADIIVRRLKSQGINVILSAGNRFITTDLEENIEKSKVIADACHRNGIKFVHHVTTTLVKKAYYKNHPDFTCIDIATGKPHYNEHYDFCTVCVNNDNYWKDYLSKMEKLFQNVNLDGIMVDEIEFWGDTLCGCKWCRKKFKADTGLELPRSKDPKFFRNLNNINYKKWLNWRNMKLQERNLEVRALMKKYMPNGGFYPSYLCNPTYTGMWNANYQNGMRLDSQAVFSSSVGIEYEPRFLNNYYNWPVAVVEMKLAKAINNSLDSNPWLYFYLTQYGDYILQWGLSMGLGFNLWYPGEQSPEKKINQARSALTGWMAKHQKLLGKTTPYSNTAVIYSNNTRDMSPEGTLWREGLIGCSQLLTDSQKSYKMILDTDLVKSQALKGVQTLIMFNTSCLSDAAVATIREFVKNGGSLLASAKVSMRDELGTIKNNFGLSDVLGVSFDSYRESMKNRLVFSTRAKDKIPGLAGSYKHNKSFVILKIINPDRNIIGKIIDVKGKEYPGVIAGKYGKGNVIYFAGHPELHYIRADHLYPYFIHPGHIWQSNMNTDYQKIIILAVDYLNPEPLLTVKNLPKGVVAEALEHNTGDVSGVSVHLINCTGAVLKEGVVPKYFEIKFPSIIPNGGIDITVRANNIQKVYLLSPDYDQITELKPIFKKGYINVNIPSLYRYGMLYFVKTGEAEFIALNDGKVTKEIPKPRKLIIDRYIPPTGKYNPQNIVFFADSPAFKGGFLNDRAIGLHTRNIFGTGASENSMRVKFSLKRPAKKIRIELYGNEYVAPGQKLPLRVVLNGKIIFEGEKMLKNKEASSKTFDISPDGFVMKDNKLEIFNLSNSTVWDTPYIRFNFVKIIPQY